MPRKPITVYRGGFGTWFGTTETVEIRPGVFQAKNQIAITSQEELSQMAGDAELMELLRAETGKSTEEIFEALGLTLQAKEK